MTAVDGQVGRDGPAAGGGPVELRTERLLLRPWRASDREPLAALNGDPVVMEHFTGTLGRPESDAMVDRIDDHFARTGWGLWAVEVLGVAPFVGFTGLWPPGYRLPWDDGGGVVEVGWRLAAAHWGRGYAPEAAVAAVRFGFEVLGLPEIVSFTVPQNANSRRVMEKIGLHRDPSRDFDHPNVRAEEHPASVRHVLYAAGRDEWLAAHPGPRAGGSD